ncbi:radical SAM protein [Haloimpatiens massiliensis]|uniref:radical SAM protein n=1 Tax=Haloimpatiens massiliensis TaxID=1658110 RepID=UPI000C865BFC|nr:radical SAM protein [Haloimpatiens massiliensis]
MNSVYLAFLDNSNLHYFGDCSIVIRDTEKYMLDDIETYIVEKINGEKTIDDIAKEIDTELEIGNFADVREKIFQFINSKKEFICTNTVPIHSEMYVTGSKKIKMPYNLIFSLTNKCHHKCIHCYKESSNEKEEHISKERILKTLNFLKGNLNSIQLTGGEPMLHDDFYEILDFCKENFKTTITTTGTLINSENAHRFKGLKNIQIPLYSANEEEHDRFTRTKGSFRKAIRAIEELIKNDIYPSIGSILAKNSVKEAEDLINLCIRLNIKRIRFGYLFPLERARNTNNVELLSEKEILKILNSLKIKYRDKINVDCDKEEDYNPKFNINQESVQPYSNSKCLLCGGGTFSLAISGNGNVKPCEIIPDDVFSMGNIINEDIEEIITNEKFENLPICMKKWQSELQNEGNDIESVCAQLKNYCLKYT